MTQGRQVEKSAMVKAVRDLRMIAVDEQTPNVIFSGRVTDALSMAKELKILRYGKVTGQV
jgi:hypothetical protein